MNRSTIPLPADRRGSPLGSFGLLLGKHYTAVIRFATTDHAQVIRAAFLTLDLVEAVLQGRAPAHLTLRQIMKQLPYDWNEQRRLLGLAPGANLSLSVRDSPVSIP